MSSRKPYVRKRYWNEPEMGWYERAYFFEVWRGIRITGGVFLANLWKFMTAARAPSPPTTRKKPAPTTPPTTAQAHPHAAARRPPAVRRLQHVRHGVPAQVIEIDAAFDPDDPRTRSTRRASRSTTRAACSAGCASRPARRTRSGW